MEFGVGVVEMRGEAEVAVASAVGAEGGGDVAGSRRWWKVTVPLVLGMASAAFNHSGGMPASAACRRSVVRWRAH